MFEPRAECMGRRCDTATARATVSGDKAPNRLPLDSSGKAGAEATLVTHNLCYGNHNRESGNLYIALFSSHCDGQEKLMMNKDHRSHQVEKDFPQINRERMANFEGGCGFAAPQCGKVMPYLIATLELRGYASNRRGTASPIATKRDDSVRPSLTGLEIGRAARTEGLHLKPTSPHRAFNRVFSLLSILTFLLAFCLNTRAQNSTSITGHVVDDHTANALGDDVRLRSREGAQLIASTDASGSFHFNNLAPGNYLVEVKA